MHVRTRVALLATVLGAALAPPASAVEYTVNACRQADGTPAPLNGWTFAVADDLPAGDVTADSCAQGGHIDLALGAGAHGTAGGPASVLLTRALPPGATWTRMRAWIAYRSTPVAGAQDPTHRVSMIVAGNPMCTWGGGAASAGCSQFGSFNAAPLADVNRVTVTPTTAGQPLSLGVMCDSSPGQCPATSGDPYATARVWGIELTINDPTVPAVPPGTEPGTPAPPAPGDANPLKGKGHVHNGTGYASSGKLTIRLRRVGSRRVRLTGRLLGDDRKPVGHARLVLRRQVKGHRATFSRIVTRRDGTFTRTLRRSSRTTRVRVRWYPWGDSPLPGESRTLQFGGRR